MLLHEAASSALPCPALKLNKQKSAALTMNRFGGEEFEMFMRRMLPRARQGFKIGRVKAAKKV